MKTTCRILLAVLFLSLLAGCSLLTSEQKTPTPETVTSQEVDENIVSASAEVMATKYASLSFMVGSQEYTLFVEEGDQVKDGDLLASLAEDGLPQDIILAQAEILGAQRDLADLVVSETARYQAEKARVLAEKEVEDAENDFINATYARASENTIQGLQAKLDLAKIELDDAEEAYGKLDDHEDGDELKALATLRLTDARKKAKDLGSQLNWNMNSSDPLDVSEKEVSLSLAKATLVDAERDYKRLQDGPDPIQLAALEARIKALESIINQKDLIAPFDGKVVKIYGHSGESITPGTPLILLADLSTLQVKTTDLSEVDVARIKIGNTVSVTFDSLPEVEVHGKVDNIALINSTGSDVYYTVSIMLDNPPAELRWGMSAYVEIEVSNN